MAKQKQKSQAQSEKQVQITITVVEGGKLSLNTNISTLMTAMALAEAQEHLLQQLVMQSLPAEQLTEAEIEATQE